MSGNSAATAANVAVPQHHAEALRVGLRDRRHALLAVAPPRQLEGKAHDALDAAPREHRRLDGDFFRLLVIHEAAHLRVFALGVLAHHDEIDLLAFAQRQRRFDAAIEHRRPHVGVLVEGAPDGQQQAVQRDVIGNLRDAPRRPAEWRPAGRNSSSASAGIMRPWRK